MTILVDVGRTALWLYACYNICKQTEVVHINIVVNVNIADKCRCLGQNPTVAYRCNLVLVTTYLPTLCYRETAKMPSPVTERIILAGKANGAIFLKFDGKYLRVREESCFLTICTPVTVDIVFSTDDMSVIRIGNDIIVTTRNESYLERSTAEKCLAGTVNTHIHI